ncbi:hypothetical protein QAD02_007367 [Eretmocerus hayati]|uniref:Uncharacterized protein n=1 Tax=Eretmocerus hayati TaxID=131215 RepID=A0ACC2N3F3_9HYME|nr:hypothetical protein QAD02_007367 [Eretmocerus hayati]
MAFVHTQSCECLKSELLLFEIPPTQTTIEGSRYIQYKPISSLTDDSPIEFIVSGNANGNAGLVSRRELCNINKKVDMIGHLHVDILNQEKLLLNNVEVRLRLVRSRDAFVLMDPSRDLTVCIEEANLLVRRVKIDPGVLIAHAKALAKTTAKYPMTRVEVKAVTMHSGSSQNVAFCCFDWVGARCVRILSRPPYLVFYPVVALG